MSHDFFLGFSFQLVQFTVPTYFIFGTYMVRTPLPKDPWNNIFRPFLPNLWFVIVMSVVALGIAACAIHKAYVKLGEAYPFHIRFAPKKKRLKEIDFVP